METKKIVKYSFPEKVGVYETTICKFSKFLVNDGHIAYFEENYIDKPKEEQITKFKFIVVSENDGYDKIPNYYEYLCSYVDNAHIRYFVYFENSIAGIFSSFSNMFGGNKFLGL